ncbi:MAG: aminoacetone oxidase family FAD-binding enzyme, partial [Clostridiales bacterium]|nr:aminoacetone oxidase family FAD-binding enzyme [Clostridiales bacterium]
GQNENKFYPADVVIIATGGLSYPATGSDGDGYRFAKSLGHTVSKLNPSLVPLKAAEQWIGALQGLSLKNCAITVKEGKTTLYKDFGEMLFTHYGVSGPVILSASRYLLGKYEKGCTISIDLKPALDEKTLDDRLLRDFSKYINKDFRNALDDLLPQKLIPVMINLSEIDPYKKVNEITKAERQRLVKRLKALDVTVTGTTGFNEAVITAGGVAVDEIDPSTMASKRIDGLKFAGELLDVDAYTGGFNLQIAFSTGHLAGSTV